MSNNERAQAQLAVYGYTLVDGVIVTPKGNRTQVKVTAQRGRFQARSIETLKLLWSGPNLSNFVEAYWYAKPLTEMAA